MRRSWARLSALGAPIVLDNLVAPAVMALVMALFARHGEAFGVAIQLEHAAILVLTVLATTMLYFVGQQLGAGRFDRIRDATGLVYGFSLVLGAHASRYSRCSAISSSRRSATTPA